LELDNSCKIIVGGWVVYFFGTQCICIKVLKALTVLEHFVQLVYSLCNFFFDAAEALALGLLHDEG